MNLDTAIESGLNALVDDVTDFGFELTVLKRLRDAGFQCSPARQAWDYDNATLKREALAADGGEGEYHIHLEVGCANIQPQDAVLLSTLPRTPEQSSHYLLRAEVNRSLQQMYPDNRPSATLEAAPISPSGLYPADTPVAQSYDHVKGLSDPGAHDDTAVLCEAIDRAVQGVLHFIKAIEIRKEELGMPTTRIIVPMVVLPDNTLWLVDYTIDGGPLTRPRTVSRASMLMRSIGMGPHDGWYPLNVSHIEFRTISGLANIRDEFFPVAFRDWHELMKELDAQD